MTSMQSLTVFLPWYSSDGQNFQEPNKWIPGIILLKLGPVTYQVEIANGCILKQHIEHLILRRESSSVSVYCP